MTQIETALYNFVAKVQANIDNFYANTYKNLSIPKLEVQNARKYYKVWNCEKERGTESFYCRSSIFAFIDKQTGEIFMPASINAPANNSRGNLLSHYNGMEALETSGTRIRYHESPSFIG